MKTPNSQIFFLIKKICAADLAFFWMAIIYGVAINLLILAVPISVQFLINSVTFTAMLRPLIVVGFSLSVLLSFWALLNGLQFYVMEIFQRRFFARIAAQFAICLADETAPKAKSVNAFFETATIQKNIPKVLTKTFTLLAQSLVGLILITFYHPIFLIFSLVIAAALWFIWANYSSEAWAGAALESQKKYQLVEEFEKISCDSLHKNNLAKIDALTEDYLKERKKHFRSLFSQVILLLALYAVASVALLMIGGWLVLRGQITLGQLVATEIILSTILYGLAQLGRDFDSIYDLGVSCEKLSQFFCNKNFVKKDFFGFTNLRKIRTPRPFKLLPKIILSALASLILLLSFVPWQQTSKGLGQIIANNPNDRAQEISAPITGRIKKWLVQDGSQVKAGEPLVEIVDNDPQILQRIGDELAAKKRKREVAQIAAQTAKINYQRQEELLNKGLAARKDFEEAKIEYKKLLASAESANSEFAEAQTKFSRQENQIVLAPKDGVILQVLASHSSTLVKAGDKIATFAPNLSDAAVEIFVNGNDIPLVHAGRKVRLQFEGWPIIQFSGWPSVAIGTFGGVVSSVDSSISQNGKFRVIVKKPADEEWPNQRFLRHGAKTNAWILLNEVKLGYEIWRQLNSFPPNFDEGLQEK